VHEQDGADRLGRIAIALVEHEQLGGAVVLGGPVILALERGGRLGHFIHRKFHMR
jgi:hypothetical protein